MDLRRLVVFRAVAKHRSLTRAAAELHFSQPAVSRQLVTLEQEVGVQLVIRGPRGVTLTPAGQALLADTHSILAMVEASRRRLRVYAAPDGGLLRLGAVPSAMAVLVPELLRRLCAERPNAELEIEEGWSSELVRRTRIGDLDLAVVSAAAAPDAGIEVLLREPFVALLPSRHKLARRKTLALSDLAGERWLVAPEPGGRQAVLDACAGAGFEPQIAGTTAWDATPGLVSSGAGVALAPASMAERLRAGTGVVARTLDDAPQRSLALLRPPDARRTGLRDDVERHLREVAGAAAP